MVDTAENLMIQVFVDGDVQYLQLANCTSLKLLGDEPTPDYWLCQQEMLVHEPASGQFLRIAQRSGDDREHLFGEVLLPEEAYSELRRARTAPPSMIADLERKLQQSLTGNATAIPHMRGADVRVYFLVMLARLNTLGQKWKALLASTGTNYGIPDSYPARCAQATIARRWSQFRTVLTAENHTSAGKTVSDVRTLLDHVDQIEREYWRSESDDLLPDERTIAPQDAKAVFRSIARCCGKLRAVVGDLSAELTPSGDWTIQNPSRGHNERRSEIANDRIREEASEASGDFGLPAEETMQSLSDGFTPEHHRLAIQLRAHEAGYDWTEIVILISRLKLGRAELDTIEDETLRFREAYFGTYRWREPSAGTDREKELELWLYLELWEAGAMSKTEIVKVLKSRFDTSRLADYEDGRATHQRATRLLEKERPRLKVRLGKRVRTRVH